MVTTREPKMSSSTTARKPNNRFNRSPGIRHRSARRLGPQETLVENRGILKSPHVVFSSLRFELVPDSRSGQKIMRAVYKKTRTYMDSFVRKGDDHLMDTTLVGRAKELEVAGRLIRNGIYVFLPLVDSGADLLAANRDASNVVPVQVKYRSEAANLNLHKKKDLPRFEKSNTVVAFVIGITKQRFWFISFRDWHSKAVDNHRRDDLVFVPIRENEKWLSKFEGDAGLRFVFKKLFA